MTSNQESKRHALTVTGPTRVVAKRVAELRHRRGWTAADLAKQCANIGAPALNRSTISNIESGRRSTIDISEVFAFALALDVAPLHLMVPTEPDPDTDQHVIAVTDDNYFTIDQMREWARGNWAPGDVDARVYFSEVPKDEWHAKHLGQDEIAARGEGTASHRALISKVQPSMAHPDFAPAEGEGFVDPDVPQGEGPDGR